MPALVYVIGAPGVGKSTVVRAALGPAERTVLKPVAHQFHQGGVVQLGREREAFSGTDALAMNAGPRVIDWLTGPDAPAVVLGEGDRLAYDGFFQAMLDSGRELHVVHLVAPRRVLEARREERALRTGSAQNPRWVRGRETRVRNLAQRWRPLRLYNTDLDATVALFQGALRAKGLLEAHSGR